MIKRPVFIRTYGCQMNSRDSEVIVGLLKKEGFKITDSSDKADVIILNTCSVRQHAEDRVWSEVGNIAKVKGQSPQAGDILAKSGTVPLIGIVGCMAQNYKENIFERSPHVNFAVGPCDIHKIPGIIKKLLANKGLFESRIWETDGNSRPEEIYHTGFYEDKKHAYVVISEGCSNYCSYCIVPYVRGELHNRNCKEILKEIERAVGAGITSITLLGQNVNAYRDDHVDFVKLAESVNLVKGLREFSFLTSHPRDTTIRLFKVMAGCDKLKKHLHLPVQSGSDRILKLMNRGYTKKFYLDLADNYRTIVKGGALTTDIIVGFPTESEGDFQDTHSLVKELEFNAAYIFKYSLRPNTAAAAMADDVDQATKEERHKAILDLQRRISGKKRCTK